MRIRAGVRSGAVRAAGNGVAHHREHTRQADPVRQDPDPERGDELKNDRRRHVLHTVDHPQREPPERRTDDDAAGHREQERRRNRADGKAMGSNGADREAINQQRAGVVQQALALEDRQDAMRWTQLAQHGGGGRGIGRRDDGAERNRRRPMASPASAREPPPRRRWS